MTYGVIIFYMIFWLILCENISLETIIIGVLVCTFIAYLNKSLIFNKKGKNIDLFNKTKYWFIYIGVLIKEIFIANFNVAKIVLSPKMDISPDVVCFQSKLKSKFYKTMLANSITLTPGTITVDINDDTFTVHCLKKEYIDGLTNSKFEQILLKLEG